MEGFILIGIGVVIAVVLCVLAPPTDDAIGFMRGWLGRGLENAGKYLRSRGWAKL